MTDGMLLLDKPVDFSSHGAVNRVKNLLGVKKAGHTGTLDPFATGVLPICFNRATKLIPYLKEDSKEYVAEMVLGISTDTMDFTGKVTSEKAFNGIEKEDIESVLSKFKGRINQIPPMYSAIKVDGKRLYKLARDGVVIERKPREVFITDLKLLGYEPPVAKLFVNCSKGTYVRALASDIGNLLGCGGHLLSLRRQSSGFFHVENASSFEEIDAGKYRIIDINEMLGFYKCIDVDKEIAIKIKNGRHLTKNLFLKSELPKFSKMDILKTLFEGNVLSLSEAKIDSSQFEYAEDKDIIFQHLKVLN